MKRLLFCMIFVALAVSLCACGNNGDTPYENEPNTPGGVSADDSSRKIIELLTSDDGEWGCFFRKPGVSIGYSYYRFYEDGATGQLMFSWDDYDILGSGQEHVYGYEGTAVVTENELVLTHLVNEEEKTDTIEYTNTDGVLELTRNGHIYHKEHWSEDIMNEIFTNGWSGEMLADVLNKGYVVDIE